MLASLDFAALTGWAFDEIGYFGIWAAGFAGPGAVQILVDLVIVCVLACVWMVGDARAQCESLALCGHHPGRGLFRSVALSAAAADVSAISAAGAHGKRRAVIGRRRCAIRVAAAVSDRDPAHQRAGEQGNALYHDQ